jgi:hypothetical protein
MTWERAALARNRGCCRHWKQEHIGVLIEADELWWSERLRSCTPIKRSRSGCNFGHLWSWQKMMISYTPLPLHHPEACTRYTLRIDKSALDCL